MDYAELTLRKELITVEWALNKWSDSQIEEHKEYYKKAKKRKEDLINAIDKLTK